MSNFNFQPIPAIDIRGGRCVQLVQGDFARETAYGDDPADMARHWQAQGARRLQFAGPICILDAYLYPPDTSAEPQVTYVDARQPDGRDIDRASCVAALTRRKEAR